MRENREHGNYCGGCAHPAPWIEAGNIEEAKSKKRDLSEFRKIGNIVTFGRYEQDNNLRNGAEEIEWIVLDYDKEKHKTLLISKYGLDTRPYNSIYASVTWETCSLRKWLNYDFLHKAFDDEEQSAILTTQVSNNSYENLWTTESGKDTQDKIFLLSYMEANLYFGITGETYIDSTNAKSRVIPTPFALFQGVLTNDSNQTVEDSATGWWWLRSPGVSQNRAAIVSYDGSLSGNYVGDSGGCIRPAFWVNLESSIF